jgi:hypothetical protein
MGLVIGLPLVVATPSRAASTGRRRHVLLGGVIATALIVSAGGADVVPTTAPIPISSFGDESLLRPLGAVLVVVATLWFATLATTRVVKDEPPSHVEADV